LKRKVRKDRLDRLLGLRRPELSRSRIQAEIMTGNVRVEGRVCDKPGTQVDENAEIILAEPENPYVSRGGLKLAGALNDLKVDVRGLIALDVGASTGGFTDCLLQHGAKKVYALDVGYGQLEKRLRDDSRVVVMERCNIRSLGPGDLPEAPELAVVDVSFISLARVLPVLAELNTAAVLALVKPQFEVGRKDAGRGGGVIRDPALQGKVLREVIDHAAENGYCSKGVAYSRLAGPKGNIEFFIFFKGGHGSACSCPSNIDAVVDQVVEHAHRSFSGKK